MALSLPLILTFIKNKLRLYSTTAEVDSKISTAISLAVVWKPSISRGSYATDELALSAVYPTATEGWTSSVSESNSVYRFDAVTNKWVHIDSSSIPMASEIDDGKMSSGDYSKLKLLPNKVQLDDILSHVSGGHVIQQDYVALPTGSKLNFTGSVDVFTDPVESDTITVNVNAPNTSEITWTTDSDFNAFGSKFDIGIENPSKNNELALKLVAGQVVDDYDTTAKLNMTDTYDMQVSNGSLKLKDGVYSGTGADSNFTVNTSSFVLDATPTPETGRTVGINIIVLSVGVDYVIVNLTTGFAVNDEVMLINLWGTPSDWSNTGKYEFLTISEIVGTKISFSSKKRNYYGTSNSDANIGIVRGTNQIVGLYRVPNFNTVTVPLNFTLTCSPLLVTMTVNTRPNGILIFRCKSLVNYGTISVAGKGYAGQSGSGLGPSGGQLPGGGYQASGQGGAGSHVTVGSVGSAPTTYGDIQDDSKLYFGASGGATYVVGSGGRGGGVIALYSDSIDLTGTVTAAGAPAGVANSANTYGPGAGGTIVIRTFYLKAGTNQVLANCPVYGSNVYGGSGVIAIYNGTQDGVITPIPSAYQHPIGSYASEGRTTSINILEAKTVTSIPFISTTVSNYPPTSSLDIQISQDAISWYDIAGTLDAKTPVPFGTKRFDLLLPWSGPNFYYRLFATSDGLDTPIVDKLVVDYEPKGYYSGLQKWESSPVSSSLVGALIKPFELKTNWSLGSGNAEPQFQLVGSNSPEFTDSVYFPSYLEYYQHTGSNNIDSGIPLDISVQASKSFIYWKLIIKLNIGSNPLETPRVKDFTLKYSIDTDRIINGVTDFTIQLNRGLKSALPYNLAQGSPYITTDTNEFYIGSIAGPTKIGDFLIQEAEPLATENIVWLQPSTGSLKRYAKTATIWVDIFQGLKDIINTKEPYLGKPSGGATNYLVASDSSGNRSFVEIPTTGLGGGSKVEYSETVYSINSLTLVTILTVAEADPKLSFLSKRIKIENLSLTDTCDIEVRNIVTNSILGSVTLMKTETGVLRLDELNGFYIQGKGIATLTYSTLVTQ